MRYRLFLGAVAVCALVAVGAAPGASAAVYQGKTAQKRFIRVGVHGKRLDMKRFKIQLKCRNGVRLVVDESGFVPTRLGRGGRFKDVQVGRTDEVFFRGRANRRMVRGQLRVKDRLHKRGPRCVSPWIKFRARRR